MIRADPEQMYRVFSNLIRNARQAMMTAGKAGRIKIRAQETHSAWELAISDTGPGLPARAQEHLFVPFQGSARKGGSGLGLAIAAELLRGHGGELTLLNTGPEGTSFYLSLPKGDGTL